MKKIIKLLALIIFCTQLFLIVDWRYKTSNYTSTLQLRYKMENISAITALQNM